MSKTYMTNAGVAGKTMCNTVHPVSRATSLSLIVCLCLAYSKPLKLTAVANAGGV